MRVLAVCESPPTVDRRYGNGSTLISHHVLSNLPPDFELDLVWFADRPVVPSPSLEARCETFESLELRRDRATRSVLATGLPRASWLRCGRYHRDRVAALARASDLVYFHGLHTFPLACDTSVPVVVNEVDPWSLYWADRAGRRRGARAWYDRVQARRAAHLERRAASKAARYIVVNPDDARVLEETLGRRVDPIPNGAPRPGAAADPTPEPVLAFVGSLDYPPNVDAARFLADRVLPAVRRTVPEARLVIAGRRPLPDVAALAGRAVEIRGDVDDVREVFRGAVAAVYPGVAGRGTKNSVLEAMAAGCPVVATPQSARGIDRSALAVVERERVAEAVIALIGDERTRCELAAAGRAAVTRLPGWPEVAHIYGALFREAATR